jgi:IclR helix-turn-helix domain
MGDREDRGRVFIQLSEEQVDRVIVSTAAVESAEQTLSELIGGQSKRSGTTTQWLFSTLMDDRSLSHSLLIGLEVLTCFPLDGTERGVAEVAKQLGMNNSTVHRYMSTLMRVGLLEQNSYTRLYRLGTGEADGHAR